MKPTELRFAALMRAIRPAQSGATALVPPMTVSVPSIRTSYPVSGSASPLTSGTPRMVSAWLPPDVSVTCSPSCQIGNWKTLLTPPPLAPPCAPLFQTDSPVIVVPDPWRLVPPQASAYGLEAGKST